MAHSGELFGYDSLLTIFRDMDFGIYTNVNGPSGEPSFITNQLLHYYTADLLLGLEPWLSTKTIVSFPEPWTDKKQYFIPKSKSPVEKGLKASSVLACYEGKFYHSFLGCAEVSCEKKGVLSLKLGRIGEFLLHPNGNPDEFRMEGRGPLEFLHNWDLYNPSDWMMVKFNFDGSECASDLVCSLFESGPVFKKVVFFIDNGWD